jgi:hypothetical protein
LGFSPTATDKLNTRGFDLIDHWPGNPQALIHKLKDGISLCYCHDRDVRRFYPVFAKKALLFHVKTFIITGQEWNEFKQKTAISL